MVGFGVRVLGGGGGNGSSAMPATGFEKVER